MHAWFRAAAGRVLAGWGSVTVIFLREGRLSSVVVSLFLSLAQLGPPQVVPIALDHSTSAYLDVTELEAHASCFLGGIVERHLT